MGTASSTRGQSIAVRPVQSATINDKAVKRQLSSTFIIPPKQPENHTIYSVEGTQKQSTEKEENAMNSTKDEITKGDNTAPAKTDLSTEGKTVDKTPGSGGDQKDQPTETGASKSADKSASEEQEENDDTATKSEEKTVTVLTEEDIEALKTKAFKSVEKNLAILSDIEGHLRENGSFNQDFKKATFNLQNANFALKKASFEVNKKFKEELGDVIVELGGVKTVCDVVVFCQKKGYYTAEDKLIQGIWIPLINCTIVLINFTDGSPKYAPLLVEHGEFLSSVSEALQQMQTKHLENNIREKDEKLLGSYFSIIHNMAQSETTITELRDHGFVELHLPFLKSNKDKVLLTCLATLADIVDESQAKHLETDGEFFKFLLKFLKSAISDKHRRCKGWSARELARTIRRISKNDVNKKGLVSQGCLPVLVSLTESTYEDEQIEAFGALWMLSFDKENQDVILQDDSVMGSFLKNRTSQCKKIKNSCNGALWNMREKLSSIDKYKELGKEYRRDEQEKAPSVGEGRGHVMISYQWANQPLIKKIRDSLQENGIKCWMDIDDMQGSTLNAMARAVEGADIVLICYSKKYYDSPNCRAEAEYAFTLKKPIIPLKMERNYQAREWLGFILGSKLFFEFTDKYPFESKMSALIKEVLTRQKKSVPDKPIISHTAPVTREKKETLGSKPKVKVQASEVVKNWKENDVLRWINHHKLPSSKFSSLTGMEIAFLQVLRQESPDFFYKTLNEMLKIKDLPTLAKFAFALEDTLV